MQINAICFDFDGVMANTEPVWIDCVHRFCVTEGVALERRALLRCMGDGDVALLDMVEKASGQRREDFLPRIRDAFDRRVAGLNTRPGVREHISYARERGIRLGLVSNSRRPYIDRWLSRLRLAGVFDCVVTRDDGLPIKPAPDMYLCAAQRLGLPPEQIMAVEDSPIGLSAAMKAGLKAVAFPNEASPEALWKEFHPSVDLAKTSPESLIRQVETLYEGGASPALAWE